MAMTLFNMTAALFDVDHELTLQERFDLFNAHNPQVLAELERMTAALVDRGRRKVGIAMLFEVMRWNWYMTTDGDDFKLNNSYRAFYARLLMDIHPEWRGVFETRNQQ